MRYLFTLIQAWKHQLQLQDYACQNEKQLTSVTALTPDLLATLGCEVLVLDFDGVLASHGELSLPEPTYQWLQSLLAESNLKCYILSNKPKQMRAQYFKTHFPSIEFVIAPQKKPYPVGLEMIIEKNQVQSQAVLLIDDRLLTGCLAAILANTKCLLLTEPLQDLNKRPIVERFFALLRWAEKKLFSK